MPIGEARRRGALGSIARALSTQLTSTRVDTISTENYSLKISCSAFRNPFKVIFIHRIFSAIIVARTKGGQKMIGFARCAVRSRALVTARRSLAEEAVPTRQKTRTVAQPTSV